jgi:hypothetical protein
MGTRLRAVGTGVEAAYSRIDRPAIRSELGPTIAAELAAAGFGDAHVVGRGGFGTVYRCQQRSLERTVAIKVLTTRDNAPGGDRCDRRPEPTTV